MDAVGYVLASRRKDSLPWGAGIAFAVLLHGGILAAVLISSLAHPLRYIPTRMVAVRLVAAGSLKTAAPATPPAEPQKPKIVKPAEETPPPPSEKAKLLPAKEEKPKAPPLAPRAPSSRAEKRGGLASAPSPGKGDAAAAGAGSTFGVSGVSFDQPDFNYSYYIERMLATIQLNWLKPDLTVMTSPVIHFRILRDGTITDAEVERSSGIPFADRAALRAVMNSSPLPPLPTEFRGDSQGVHLIFE